MKKKLDVGQRSQVAETTRKFKAQIRKLVLAELGGKCVRCGFTDWRALQIDHIIPLKSTKRDYWADAKRILDGDKSNFQLLCANCNWIKKHEGREFGITHFELEVQK